MVGLDIGSTKVCAVVAEMQDSLSPDIVITGSALSCCEGIRAGVVTDPPSVSRAIEQAVDQAGAQAGCNVESVYIGVTGAHISSLTSIGRIAITTSRREIGQREIDEVINASKKIVLPPDRQIIHAIPLSFSVDGVDCPRIPNGERGQQLEVHTHIVHGAIELLGNVEKCVSTAGLDINETVLEAVAAGEAVLLPEEKESGVCLLDIGGYSSNLGVFVSGVIFHSAVIPVGGNHVTNDIVYGLTVGYAEAERLKLEDGLALVELVPQDDVVSVRQVGRDTARRLRRRALVQIIEPRMQEVLQLAIEELTLANCLDKIPCGLVVTGGGSLMNGCLEMVEQALGLPVRLGRACSAGGLNSTLKQPAYATAIGLAQYGALGSYSAARQSEVPKQEIVRTVWDQLVRLVKRTPQ